MSERELHVKYKGEKADVFVYTSAPTWNYKNKPNWCTITKYSDSFQLTVSENTTNQQRTAKIKFYVEGDSKTLKIIQEATPYNSSSKVITSKTEDISGKNNQCSNSNTNKTFTVNGIQFTMVYVQGGTFTMGATLEQKNDAYGWELPAHGITLNSYYIGETEVTQALWQAVMGTNPSYNKGSNYPVERVSYDDCKKIISKLNSLTGQSFRLPTEAEWEYAARGGNKSRGYKYAGSNNVLSVAWYTEDSGDYTHVVKCKSPNELGLYDMSGNVLEWCNDWYGDYSSYSQTNPQGPSSGSNRVYRGGSYHGIERCCRVSYRNYDTPSRSRSNLGLRLALYPINVVK